MSARTMWSGTISLGLFSFPVTIGKSWSEERERGLRDLCCIHEVPVDRTERCSFEKGVCNLEGGKVKGVEVDGEWRVFSSDEYDAIEEATKSDTLEILDVQPAYDLPLDFAIGTYWVRHNTKAKGSRPDAFAHFVEALNRDDRGAIVKWCKSTRQTLAILHTDASGHLLLSAIPYANEIRTAGQAEDAHKDVEISDEVIEQMRELLNAVATDGFDHSVYSDDGVKLRSDAIEKVIARDGGDQKHEENDQEDSGDNTKVPDLMAALRQSIAGVKKSTKEKA